jgi:hypothetical protein
MFNPYWMILAVILFIVAAFLTGYTMAETKERVAAEKLRQSLQRVQQAKYQLTQWVRTNWPNEFEAYRAGHKVGYQQGVLQAADLELQANEET